jgi:hypothetical protein
MSTAIAAPSASTQAATPLPWIASSREITADNGLTRVIVRTPQHSEAQLGKHGYQQAIERDKANLQFIATACNAHAALIAENELLRHAYDYALECFVASNMKAAACILDAKRRGVA